MCAEPGSVLTAAHEPPFAGDAVTTIDRHRLVRRSGWPPRHDPFRPPENLLGHVRVEIGTGGRATVALTNHPPGRPVRHCERLCHLSEDRGSELHPAHGFRLQHGEKSALDQGLDDRFSEFSLRVLLRSGRGDHGHEIAGLLDLRMDGGHSVSPFRGDAVPMHNSFAPRPGQESHTSGTACRPCWVRIPPHRLPLDAATALPTAITTGMATAAWWLRMRPRSTRSTSAASSRSGRCFGPRSSTWSATSSAWNGR